MWYVVINCKLAFRDVFMDFEKTLQKRPHLDLANVILAVC